MEVRSIMCACGSGLGSSLMVQMKSDITVGHTTTSDVTPGMADLFVVGRDLADFIKGVPEERKIVLTNIVDKNELKEKLVAAFEQ